MKFCAECGTKLEDGDLFCPECGTKAEVVQPVAVAEPQPQPEPEPQPQPQPQPQPVPQAESDPRPAPTSRYAPVSAWGYVGNFFLLCIPLVGFVLTIVWACGGCHKINKRNMARGILLFYLLLLVLAIIAVIVTVVIAIAAGSALMPILREIFYNFIYSLY